MINKKFSLVVLAGLTIVIILIGGLFWFKKNQAVIQEQGQAQQTNSSNNPASASESPAVNNQDIDNKLKALDDDAKEIDQGLNDQPLDVLEEE